MEFIVVCPHCGNDIYIDRWHFQDVEYYHHYGNFSANGTVYCDSCDNKSVLNIEFEVVNHNISKVVD